MIDPKEIREALERADLKGEEIRCIDNDFGPPSLSVHGWMKSTTIADELKSGPLRTEGPTWDTARVLLHAPTWLSQLCDEVESLRAKLAGYHD